MAVLYLEFIFCAALIIASGSSLTKYGDVISEKTGLGGVWIGLVLMAIVTSLPELATGISSVAVVGAPDIAVGDIMGSLVFNLSLLALMDVLCGKDSIFAGVSRGHLLSAGFGILLITMVLVSMVFGGEVPSFGHVGIYTPVLALVYIIGVRAVYHYEKTAVGEYIESARARLLYADVPLRRAVVLCAINAAVVVGAATWLPYIADGLAQTTSLGRTFMGSVFVAATTSMPELVVSVSAIKIGAKDMAIANILGSNMFDIAILPIDDVFYTAGPLFSAISPSHIITGIMAAMMTAVVIIGLTQPARGKKFLRMGRGSMTIAGLWLSTVYLLYITRAG